MAAVEIKSDSITYETRVSLSVKGIRGFQVGNAGRTTYFLLDNRFRCRVDNPNLQTVSFCWIDNVGRPQVSTYQRNRCRITPLYKEEIPAVSEVINSLKL